MDPLTMLIAAGAAMSVAGIGVGGGLFSAKQNYKYSSRLMSKQQKWMEKMSNSAHQREVADLRAAGLNPILSSHSSGSQVGSASSPSVTTPNLGEAAIDGIKAGVDVLGAGANIANTQADTGLKEAEIETQKTAQSLNRANAKKAQADANLTNAKLAKEAASPYTSLVGKDISAMTKQMYGFGEKAHSYLFDRQKSSATKKNYHNNSGKHSANSYSDYSVNGAEVNKRSPDISKYKFNDKSEKPRIMKYRIDKDGKFHWVN